MFACVMTRATRAAPQDYGTPDHLLQALTPFDQADVQGQWSDARMLMTQALTWNTPQSHHETAPEVCAETGRVIVSWVRLDNREALCRQLDLTPAPTLTDPQIILASHRQWGAECAARLEGDFSFVIYDPSGGEVFCARDAIGTRPFYYVLTDEVFAAATSLVALRDLEGVGASVSQNWVALFVTNMNWAQTDTAYEGVSKLAAAHHMTVQREACHGPTRYFDFDLEAPFATHRDEIWVERYRDLFDQVVKDRAHSAYLVGAESSAGLDSSSIVARLAQVLPHSRDDFHTFGMALMEDEPALLLATGVMNDVRHSHVLTTPVLLGNGAAFQRAMQVIGHPPEHGQMTIHPSFFELSQHLGIRTIMSGFGGDEIVTNQAGALFEELQARRAYGTLLRELPGNPLARAVRLGKRLWRGLPEPIILAQNNARAKLASSCLRDDVIEDAGLRDQVEHWINPEGTSHQVNAMTGLLPGFTHARISRLESASLYSASYKVDYRWPLLDRRLIQQFFATPSIEKRHRYMGRYLHRRAMQGRIPDRILWQATKDMGSHLGGRPNVPPETDWQYGDLPAQIRDLVDCKKYERFLEHRRRKNADFSNATAHAVMGISQVEKLAEWL